MSRKHYAAIAKIIKENNDKYKIANELARFFKQDNSAFDKSCFLAVCEQPS